MFSIPAIAATLWAVILGGIGGLLTEIGPWYRALKKPSFQPPDWAFGPAWTLILGLAARSKAPVRRFRSLSPNLPAIGHWTSLNVPASAPCFGDNDSPLQSFWGERACCA